MTAVLSFGTNLGDRFARLRCGLEVVAQHVAVSAISPVYETAPVGVEDQPSFLNVVAIVATSDPETALRAAHAAEDSQGRLRSRRWGPRTLDVDVIVVDEIRMEDPRLTLPHPRAAARGFVLVPWLAIDPSAMLPGGGPIRSLAESMATQAVRRVADPLPLP